MIAKFTRGSDHRLGIRFEPETFEEQLLLEIFTRDAAKHPFRFSSWEHHHSGRTMREGLTSVWGEIVVEREPLEQKGSESPVEGPVENPVEGP